MSGYRIREATTLDLEGITEIYNHYVLHDHATFDVEAVTLGNRREWFKQFGPLGRCCLVADSSEGVVGYACSGQFKVKPGYDNSVEVSVYLNPDHLGHGLGRRLYADLIPRLDSASVHRAYAVIALPNDASLALHREFGFEQQCVLDQAGRKFDRFWDVAYLARRPGGDAS